MFATRTPTAELTAGTDYAVVPTLFKARFVSRDAAAGTVTLQVPEPVGATDSGDTTKESEKENAGRPRPRTATVTVPAWLATSLFAFYDTRDVPALKDCGAPTVAHAGDEGQDSTVAGFVVLPEVNIWARPRPVITPAEPSDCSQTVLKLRSPRLPSTTSVADASAFQQADPAALLLLTSSSPPVRHKVVPMIVFEHVVAPFASHLHCETLEEGLGAVTALAVKDHAPTFEALLSETLRRTNHLKSLEVRGNEHIPRYAKLFTFRNVAAMLTSLRCTCRHGLTTDFGSNALVYPALRRLAISSFAPDAAAGVSQACPNLEDISLTTEDWEDAVPRTPTLFPRIKALRLFVAWRAKEVIVAALATAKARSLSVLALTFTPDSVTLEPEFAAHTGCTLRVPDSVAELILDGCDIFNARGLGVGIPLLFTSSSLKKLVLPETDVGSCTGSTAWATTTSPITHLVVKDVTKSRRVCSVAPSELGDTTSGSAALPSVSPVNDPSQRVQGAQDARAFNDTANSVSATKPVGLAPQGGANPFAAAAATVQPVPNAFSAFASTTAPGFPVTPPVVTPPRSAAASSSSPSPGNPFAAASASWGAPSWGVTVPRNNKRKSADTATEDAPKANPFATAGSVRFDLSTPAPGSPSQTTPPAAATPSTNPFAVAARFVKSSTSFEPSNGAPSLPSSVAPPSANAPHANPFSAFTGLSETPLVVAPPPVTAVVATTPFANPFAAAAPVAPSGLATQSVPVVGSEGGEAQCRATLMSAEDDSTGVFVSGLEATLRTVDFHNSGQRWHRGSGEEEWKAEPLAAERAVPSGSVRLRGACEQ